MKSVGEAMGIGRSFTEAFLKAKRAREVDDAWEPRNLHPWFEAELDQAREVLAGVTDVDQLVADDWVRVKRAGWSDLDLAARCGTTEEAVRAKRRSSECGLCFGGSTPVPARSRPLRPTTTRPGASRTRLLRKGTVHGS